MSLTGNLIKSIGGLFTKSRRDRVVELVPNYMASANTSYQFNWARSEFINAYRGWNYVAIKAICEEIAGLSPSIMKREDGREVHEQYRKSIKAATWEERAAITESHRRLYLSKSMKRKALANLQDSDELKPVSHDHPLCKLLRKPNPSDVSWTFWYKVFMYLELTGASYIWKAKNRLGRTTQLWVVPSHWVFEFPDREGEKLIGYYEIRPSVGVYPLDTGYGAGWFPGGGGSERRPADQFIKIAYPSPYTLVDGYAPVQAIGTWIDVSNNIDRSRVQKFANGAFPGVVLELDKGITDPPDEAAGERIRTAFAETYQGVRNTGKPAILGPGMKMVPYGQTSVEMDYTNSADQSRGNLMAAHRVPQSIAGIVELSTFANAAAAKSNFYSSCIKPKLVLTGQKLTEELANEYDEDLIAYWNEPEAANADPDFKLKADDTRLKNQTKTPNEVREDNGDAPWEHGGDDPMGSPGMQPIPWNTGEEPMQMPGMQPGGMPGQEQQPQDGGDDAMDSVMQTLLNGDGASEPSGEKSLNRIASMNGNGNGKGH